MNDLSSAQLRTLREAIHGGEEMLPVIKAIIPDDISFFKKIVVDDCMESVDVLHVSHGTGLESGPYQVQISHNEVSAYAQYSGGHYRIVSSKDTESMALAWLDALIGLLIHHKNWEESK